MKLVRRLGVAKDAFATSSRRVFSRQAQALDDFKSSTFAPRYAPHPQQHLSAEESLQNPSASQANDAARLPGSLPERDPRSNLHLHPRIFLKRSHSFAMDYRSYSVHDHLAHMQTDPTRVQGNHLASQWVVSATVDRDILEIQRLDGTR